ncbi:MAG TPA: hypothetical protein VI072_18550 [Polyangiaceae bacterium]
MMKRAYAGALALSFCAAGCNSPTPEPTDEVTGGAQLPCDVAEVLHNECLLCHSSVLALGAPMPLVTYADTQATHKGEPVWKAMQRAISSGKMPAFGTLTAEQKSVLEGWFAKNAPPSKSVCEETGGVPGAGADNRGMATLGNDKIVIPAATQDFEITTTCSTLSKNGKPVLIVASMPHMHYFGTSITTEHFRDGVSLGFVSSYAKGTFTWTDYDSTPYGHEYLPGDTLVTKCRYDNPNSYAAGFPAEMCYNFLLVSPIAEANASCADE